MVAVSLKKKIFFKQKTAYEILRSDWSSDVCSSDLKEKEKNISEINAAAWQQITMGVMMIPHPHCNVVVNLIKKQFPQAVAI